MRHCSSWKSAQQKARTSAKMQDDADVNLVDSPTQAECGQTGLSSGGFGCVKFMLGTEELLYQDEAD